jgi:S1-C subfamily serine protease
MLLNAEGEVLTNAHVVSDADKLTVLLSGQGKSRAAEVVGIDEKEDIALIRITGVAGLRVADIGDSEGVRLGQDVFAVGHALGLNGGPSVTRGVVSGLSRSNGPLSDLSQTDAALNPGNSGGPLFDASGRVLGVNTMVRSGAQNIGFAIPISRATSIAARLRSGQPAPKTALLGVTSREPEDGSAGAEVVEVSSGDPADGAGLETGDRIIAVNGKPVNGPGSLAGLIGSKSPGEKVTLTYERGDEKKTVQVVLGTRPFD